MGYAKTLVVAGVWAAYWLMSAAVAQEPGTEPRGESGANQSESPSGGVGQTISDAATTARVKSRLLMDDSTDGIRINVDTRNAEVTLNGTVKSEVERYQAEKIARETEGVRSVHNNLLVASASHDKISPEKAGGGTGYGE